MTTGFHCHPIAKDDVSAPKLPALVFNGDDARSLAHLVFNHLFGVDLTRLFALSAIAGNGWATINPISGQKRHRDDRDQDARQLDRQPYRSLAVAT
jgi:hypothetical protein